MFYLREANKMTKKLESEHEKLMKKAQQQPGIKELMIVYGQYEEMLRQSHEYLLGVMPKEIISATNNTSY